MQHEAVVELHRAAEEHRLRHQRRVAQLDVHLLEQRLERDVDRAVHHDAERAALVVLADEGEGAGKIRVRHRRHGDEEVAGKVDRLHWPPVAYFNPSGRLAQIGPQGFPDLPAYRSALFWFRRDLRDGDNAGLYYALRSSGHVYCVFVFDTEILEALPSRADRRVEFIHDAISELSRSIEAKGGRLLVLHDRARDAIPALARRLGVDAVFANGDYEPAARSRDDAVARRSSPTGDASTSRRTRRSSRRTR